MQPTISIINKSQLEEGRLDAEFYQPTFLQNKQNIDNTENDTLGNLTTKIVVGFVSSMVSQYEDEGIDLLQTRNVAEFFVKTDEVIKINPEFHQKLKKSQVKQGDILIARSGSFGNASLYLEDKTVNSADIIIVEADKSKINPFYLTAFLNSQKGKLQLYRFASGGLQGHVNTTILHNLKISKATDGIEKAIQELITKSYEAKTSSENTLRDINDLLLKNLGFDEFASSKVNYSSRSFADYSKTNRLDSEYWLPKYDEIEEKIKLYSNGYDSFDKLIKVSSETINIESDEKYKYAELANVNANVGLTEGLDELSGNELPSRAKMKLRKNDVVLSSVEGSADKVAIIKDEIDNLVGSTGFYVLREDYFLPEVILALFRIPFINALFKRQAQGTILTAVPRSSLSRIILPKLAKPYQEQIATQIREAQVLYEKSKRLLGVAKHAVDIFVERDEQAGLDYIEQNRA